MTTDVVILAAGKGSRMKSKLPKVLQPLAKKALLQHVLDTAKSLSDSSLHVVIGHGADEVKNRISDKVNWCLQAEQLGTGHAVQQALAALSNKGKTLVLYGDVPLVKAETLNQLIALTKPTQIALLTVSLTNPTGYGRIIREDNKVVAIVEQKDANPEQLKVQEVNTGILCIDNQLLRALIPSIQNQNAQGEYYLTDIIALAEKQGNNIEALCINDEVEVQGVNDKIQLQTLERAYQQQQAEDLMRDGVTIIDSTRFDIRGKLSAAADVSIDVNCVFEGEVNIGEGVSIGPNCIIGSMGKTTSIANNTEIKANTIIEEGVIGANCVLGPYARIRPGTEIADNAKIGNFVETKKTQLGEGSKINHLSYVGDAIVGKNVNIGAGTITCNYDGVNKFQTIIEDEAFIGSNTSLVAPVKVGKTATVGAGSTITKSVDDENLAIARGKQKNLSGWERPSKKEN